MRHVKGTARQRVLDFVLRRPGATAAQVGRALKLSPATVRHHLRILRKDGRIVPAGPSRAGTRGHPSESYRPSERLLGENLGLIADSLLRAWPKELGASAPTGMIESLTNGLLQRLGDPRPAESLTRRLADLVDGLTEAHYQARWEAGAEGPHIIFGHCPYAAIIEGHPELCQMDQAALAGYMGGEVAQLARIDVRGSGVNQCEFALGHKGAPAAKD